MITNFETNFVVNIEDFIIKDNQPYTIFFKATCPVFHDNVFELEYTGSELSYNPPLPEQYMDSVKEKLQEVFGYGPFDKRSVKASLDKCRQIRVPQ